LTPSSPKPENDPSVLLSYYAAHAALHALWSEAVGTPGYDKRSWMALSNSLDALGRSAATLVGFPRDQPLFPPAQEAP